MDLKIRERREALGLTQTELAKRVGKSFRTIQSWERGESYPNAEYVSVLCDVFDTDPNDLCDWYATHPRERPRQARLDQEREALLANYDRCTPERRERILTDAREKALLSQEYSERAADAAQGA
ncbi:helix-turn-helix transcriptional regulator [uncultured Parolsenella sp.]|uniref:helix-turn-helix transcriptional regulator n=1 Tax=uncultured Parolsenella sp. TaxID=2083008 RepID=UPI0025DE41B2|nr:helix-turn-helix transcriptional regulator [uncultured Parolsenella sp.]